MQPIGQIITEAKNAGITIKLITTELAENFLLHIKISALIGIMLSIPLILWEIIKFVIPALEKKSHIKVYLLLLFSIVLFWAGIACARLWVWPTLNSFFITRWYMPYIPIDNILVSTEIHLTLQKYLNLFFAFHFIFGLFFQIPVVSTILAYLKILKFSFFTKQWRYSFVVIAVASATITPPDIFSMFAFMLPLIFLYCISAIIVLIINRKK